MAPGLLYGAGAYRTGALVEGVVQVLTVMVLLVVMPALIYGVRNREKKRRHNELLDAIRSQRGGVPPAPDITRVRRP